MFSTFYSTFENLPFRIRLVFPEGAVPDNAIVVVLPDDDVQAMRIPLPPFKVDTYGHLEARAGVVTAEGAAADYQRTLRGFAEQVLGKEDFGAMVARIRREFPCWMD